MTLKGTLTTAPAQAVTSFGWLTTGKGVMVIVKFSDGPAQLPFSSGVTVMVETCKTLTLALSTFMSPTPEAGIPVAVLLLVQAYVVVGDEPVKMTDIRSPAHRLCPGGGVTVGTG